MNRFVGNFACTVFVFMICSCAFGADMSRAVDVIVNDLRPYVGTVKVPAYTFSYTTYNALGLTPGTPLSMDRDEVRNYFKNKVNGWLNGPDGSDSEPGLYVALDPMASRNFGGRSNTDWVLYRVEVPLGMRYLNVSQYSDRHLTGAPKSIAAEMDKAGCRLSRLSEAGGINYEDIFIRNKNQEVACRRIADAVVKRLNVDAIKYSYKAEKMPECLPKPDAHMDLSAFIIIKTSKFRPGSVQVFSRSVSDDPSVQNEMTQIAAVMNEAGYGPYPWLQLWPELADYKSPDLQQWKQAHLVNCQTSRTQ